MEKEELCLWILLASGLGTVVLSLSLAVISPNKNEEQFRKECASAGGVTVHNGKFYECFRGNVK